MNNQGLIFGVSDFVAVVNQTLEYAYSSVAIVGELANFKVSKNRWVYFDLKDENASIRFFGSVYMLPGPLEDGMVLEVVGSPRLHPLYGFNVNVRAMRPVGEGSIKKAANLLEAKLRKEGLFDESRKRRLPYPPERIGLITSQESAAYADFTKIIKARWGGVEIQLADVQVQGAQSPEQIVSALTWFNQQANPPEVLVIIRGGGSADDLQAFSAEQVVRAVGGSRIPVLVAIGHEVDISLAELAADVRASTPSNAAELLVPDHRAVIERLHTLRSRLGDMVHVRIAQERQTYERARQDLRRIVSQMIAQETSIIEAKVRLLTALNPKTALSRGFAIIRNQKGQIIRQAVNAQVNDIVHIELARARLVGRITESRDVG